MKVGVKFCGHCAPRRDMGVLYEEIRSDMPDINFVYRSQDPETDALLVLCACPAACATVPDDITGPIITATPYTVNNRNITTDLKEEIIKEVLRWTT